ncbi:MAG TPA: sigma-54 dependent transcriptional regulator [Terriglobales bacterium]|nr:sigma-54 dependent transcriptional regulator [Terriglobales bacterium]
MLLGPGDTLREAARELAPSVGFSVQSSARSDDVLRLLEAQRVDALIVESTASDGTLLDLLREIKTRRPDCEVVVISESASVSLAVQAVKLGAYDFLPKPFDLQDLNALLQRLAAHVRMTQESRLLRDSMRTRQGFGSIVGRSPEMEKLYRIISKAAFSTHPVLVLGESGTGKELVARSIHYSGPNQDKPFIPVDCGSLVPTLIESELFGYVRGAFTGAVRSKEGLLSIANGGTVFLDEVGELPVDLQAKLLRALQEKEIRPVGSTHSVKIDVRVLAATNRDLETAVEKGAFRKDLFYRLNVLTLRIPPLRERRGDIPMLAEYFLERITNAGGGPRTISSEAMELLMAYDWPGNVRELENCIERACAMSSGPGLHVGDLPTSIQNSRLGVAPVATDASGIVPLLELERRAIVSALERLNGDKLLAARLLGIGKTTLYRKLKEYSFRD